MEDTICFYLFFVVFSWRCAKEFRCNNLRVVVTEGKPRRYLQCRYCRNFHLYTLTQESSMTQTAIKTSTQPARTTPPQKFQPHAPRTRHLLIS